MKEFAAMLVREKLLQQVFVELNNFTDLKPSIDTILKYIKVLSSCDSVAIRLKGNPGEGAPYYSYDGFSNTFIEHENDICLPSGSTELKDPTVCFYYCMCGAVLTGDTDVIYPFFTPGGSFWTNNTTELITTMPQEEIELLNMSGYCNLCGYESMALIPIKYNDEIIGLLQLNSKMQDKFSGDIIECLELVGLQIGVSIYNRYKYTQLLEYYQLHKTNIAAHA